MENIPNPPSLNLTAETQILECQPILRDILQENLLAIYLYGSSLLGGLKKYSDIDLFVVVEQALTNEEKVKLTTELLKISGIYVNYPPLKRQA